MSLRNRQIYPATVQLCNVFFQSMRTSKDDIYAAGDITEFPLFMLNDEKVNVQHWQMAHQQGRLRCVQIAIQVLFLCVKF